MVKVALLGSTGGIGRPLSLLLKLNNNISHLSLYDITPSSSLEADLSYINTTPIITTHSGSKNLPEAIIGSQIIIILASIPLENSMLTRNCFFDKNAPIIRDLAMQIAIYNPKAFVLAVTNPINSILPIICQVYKDYNNYNFKKILGLTSIDCIRAAAFLNQMIEGIDPLSVKVPIIGGHCNSTIVPLFSHITPKLSLTNHQIIELTNRIKFAGFDLVKAKGGSQSATLSMAHAVAKFTSSIVNTLTNNESFVDSAYVCLNTNYEAKLKVESLVGKVEYLASSIEINSNGVNKIWLPKQISGFEKGLVNRAIISLNQSVAKSEQFCKASEPLISLKRNINSTKLTKKAIFNGTKKPLCYI
jgi:malate dehydrogenase